MKKINVDDKVWSNKNIHTLEDYIVKELNLLLKENIPVTNFLRQFGIIVLPPIDGKRKNRIISEQKENFVTIAIEHSLSSWDNNNWDAEPCWTVFLELFVINIEKKEIYTNEKNAKVSIDFHQEQKMVFDNVLTEKTNCFKVKYEGNPSHPYLETNIVLGDV